jgi:hypothetical protein
MKKRKAQTTIFIIIAIVVVAAIILTIILTKTQKSETELENVFSQLGIQVQASTVQTSIIDCLSETATGAIEVIGIQGGYYNPPKNKDHYLDLEWTFIPYYYKKGEFLQPSNEKIQQELSAYIDENIQECINTLEYNDFELEFKSAQSTAEIKSKQITFKTDLLTSISKDSSTSTFNLKQHPVTINSKLFEIIEIATFITDSHIESPDMICATCIADMGEERKLKVEMSNYETPETTLIIISDNQTSTNPYIFEFLNEYQI